MKSRHEATAAITLVPSFSPSVQNAGGWPEDQQWWGGGRTKGELPLEIHARVQRCRSLLHIPIHLFALQASVRAHVCVNVHYSRPLCCIQSLLIQSPIQRWSSAYVEAHSIVRCQTAFIRTVPPRSLSVTSQTPEFILFKQPSFIFEFKGRLFLFWARPIPKILIILKFHNNLIQSAELKPKASYRNGNWRH